MSYSRILVIRRDNIGDLLCTTPLFAALRNHYPDAWIGVLTNHYNGPILAGNPDINASFTYRKAKHRSAGESRLAIWGETAALLWRLRRKKLDLVLCASVGGYRFARLLAAQRDIHIDHIGEPLDPELGAAARATMAAAPNYRWLGGRPHEEVRRRIQRAHLLIHASRMEGGAHVVMEAVASGTPVLASRIDGNVGMLGADYAGYFPWGDADALAALILHCQKSRRWRDGANLLEQLSAQCRCRAPLFEPATERSALRRLVNELLGEH